MSSSLDWLLSHWAHFSISVSKVANLAQIVHNLNRNNSIKQYNISLKFGTANTLETFKVKGSKVKVMP